MCDWIVLQVNSSELTDRIPEAGDLSVGEAIPARVIGVVHVVIDSCRKDNE